MGADEDSLGAEEFSPRAGDAEELPTELTDTGNAAQLNASFSPSQTSPRMQTFSNQAYTNTLPSSLLPKSTQSMRQFGYLKSNFAMGHSMPSKYCNAVSSVSSSTLSIAEVMKAAGFSSTPQNVLGNNSDRPSLTQHLVNQYSQMTQLQNLMDSSSCLKTIIGQGLSASFCW